MLLGALVVVTAGCQLRIELGVDVHGGGEGRVRVAAALDDAALARIPDLEDRLELDDLIASGWEISGPAREEDGRTWIRAAKGFSAEEPAAAVIAQVSGPDGPFRDFEVATNGGWFRSIHRLEGTVDLSAATDEALDGRVEGASVPDEADLRAMTDTALDRLFRFRVSTRLPGGVEANAPTVVDGGAVWQPRLGEHVTLRAESTEWHGGRIAATAVAGLVLLAAAGLGVPRVVRRRPA